MTAAEYVEAERLRKTWHIPEYTLQYEEAKKKAERKEMWHWRNWVRILICGLPWMAAMILVPTLHILWLYKFCIYVVSMGFFQALYGRAFNRAVLKRLNAGLRARED